MGARNLVRGARSRVGRGLAGSERGRRAMAEAAVVEAAAAAARAVSAAREAAASMG